MTSIATPTPGSDPSWLLWIVAAAVGFLGAWAFAGYLRRANHDGPRAASRELLLGALALASGIWGASIIGLSSLGLPFEIGYHPLKLLAALAAPAVLTVVLSLLAVLLRNVLVHVVLAGLFAAVALAVPLAAVWSIGPEPGIVWRREVLVFALLLAAVGHLALLRMVIPVVRGSSNDRSNRRLAAALLLGMTLAGAREMVLIAGDLGRQQASSYLHMLPEVAVVLAAGGGVTLLLLLFLLDQNMQARIRAANRRRGRRKHRHRTAQVSAAGGQRSPTPAAPTAPTMPTSPTRR